MLYFWIVATVAFIALEAATVGLVSVWFALGSAAALIGAALGAEVWLQVVLFLAVSAVALAVLKPVAVKYFKVGAKPTNADRLLGVVCPVTEDIDNIHATGAVSAGGKEWTARSLTGEPIPKGALAQVMSIQGVKLIVEPARRPAETK